jgi:hypothetical protein
MTLPVSDARSNHPDQVAYIAGALGNAKDRIKVFLFIHKGKRKFKTATEIARGTGMRRKRVLEEGKRLVHKEVVRQEKIDGEIGYYRDAVSYANLSKIISLATNKKKLAAFATKSNPKVTVVKVSAPRSLVRTATITIDDMESFSKTKHVKGSGAVGISESRFKQGVQRIVGEKGRFKDWGGETSDLWTTKVRHKGGKRVATAFAFKGPGMKGILVPGKLGKNGDQIQRLFQEDADVYFVQYVGQIAPSVLVNMAPFAQAKSLSTGRKIYYGVIDGDDSGRLIAAYPWAFKVRRKTSHA